MGWTNIDDFQTMTDRELAEAAVMMELVIRKLDAELDVANAPVTEVTWEKIVPWIKTMGHYNAALMMNGRCINWESYINKTMSVWVKRLVAADKERAWEALQE